MSKLLTIQRDTLKEIQSVLKAIRDNDTTRKYKVSEHSKTYFTRLQKHEVDPVLKKVNNLLNENIQT